MAMMVAAPIGVLVLGCWSMAEPQPWASRGHNLIKSHILILGAHFCFVKRKQILASNAVPLNLF